MLVIDEHRDASVLQVRGSGVLLAPLALVQDCLDLHSPVMGLLERCGYRRRGERVRLTRIEALALSISLTMASCPPPLGEKYTWTGVFFKSDRPPASGRPSATQQGKIQELLHGRHTLQADTPAFSASSLALNTAVQALQSKYRHPGDGRCGNGTFAVEDGRLLSRRDVGKQERSEQQADGQDGRDDGKTRFGHRVLGKALPLDKRKVR